MLAQMFGVSTVALPFPLTSECEKTQSTIFMVKLVEKGKETM
jgi:hypothetical protein